MRCISIKRIQGELKAFAKNPISGITIELRNPEDIKHLKGTFKGFTDSPYEGGLYEVDIKIPDNYPYNPPKVYFVTKVWHPNISSVTGCICLDLLGANWSLQHSLKTIIASINALLILAEPNDALDFQVAAQFEHNYGLYLKTAAFWNYIYAGGPYKDDFQDFSEMLDNLAKMGFNKDSALHVLSMKNWNPDEAIKYL